MKRILLFVQIVLLFACNEKNPVYSSIIGKWKLESDAMIYKDGRSTGTQGHVVAEFEIITDPNNSHSDTLYVTRPLVTYLDETSISMGSSVFMIQKANGFYDIMFYFISSKNYNNGARFKACYRNGEFTELTAEPYMPNIYLAGSYIMVYGLDGTETNKVLIFEQTISIKRVN